VASFDIFVHTGKHETFCQGIQEALASGVPVIGPDTGGPVDLIEHGITGLLIDTADPHELLEAVATLRNHSSFDLMQLAARRSVEHRTWDYINSQLISHYQDAIDQVSRERGLVA
jgi:phosphatidylinositol alpha 1,6-mannosyltransferase